MIPHRYPFRLIDVVKPDPTVPGRAAPGRATLRLTANGAIARETVFPAVLAIEILAQASMVVLGRGGGGLGYLAGADDVELGPALRERPLAPGDTLEATVSQTAAFGSILKVRGQLDRDGRTVATANLMLSIPDEGER
ncbi:MAG: hypothetical protein GY856_11310 [bacterium]|nr:hypothetical protein [bacterium]